MTTSSPNICFVAHNAFGALAGIDSGHVGGIETQQSLMAHWLAKNSFTVSMITWDEGHANGELIGGVRVFNLSRREAGIRGLRFFHPRWTSLIRAMRLADADVYYYNCGDLGLGQIVLWTRKNRKKSVYSVANTPDCDPRMPTLKPLRERLLYKFGLKNVDIVLAQTLTQQKMLRAGFGIHATVLPMPCTGFLLNNPIVAQLPRESSPRILWVGRFCKEKRLEWLLDIAGAIPDIIFDVVGGANAYTDYAENLIERAKSIPNVVLHGRVLHRDLGKLYRQADLLCCTSEYEGFPNIFLEAWSVGLPIVSTYDPDGLIASHGLGKVAHQIRDLRDAIISLLSQPDDYKAASNASRAYFEKNHTLDAVMPLFIQALQMKQSVKMH